MSRLHWFQQHPLNQPGPFCITALLDKFISLTWVRVDAVFPICFSWLNMCNFDFPKPSLHRWVRVSLLQPGSSTRLARYARELVMGWTQQRWDACRYSNQRHSNLHLVLGRAILGYVCQTWGCSALTTEPARNLLHEEIAFSLAVPSPWNLFSSKWLYL